MNVVNSFILSCFEQQRFHCVELLDLLSVQKFFIEQESPLASGSTSHSSHLSAESKILILVFLCVLSSSLICLILVKLGFSQNKLRSWREPHLELSMLMVAIAYFSNVYLKISALPSFLPCLPLLFPSLPSSLPCFCIQLLLLTSLFLLFFFTSFTYFPYLISYSHFHFVFLLLIYFIVSFILLPFFFPFLNYLYLVFLSLLSLLPSLVSSLLHFSASFLSLLFCYFPFLVSFLTSFNSLAFLAFLIFSSYSHFHFLT